MIHPWKERNNINMFYRYVQGTTTSWWFGAFFHILGISSSWLTFIFFRGAVSTTNQTRFWTQFSCCPPVIWVVRIRSILITPWTALPAPERRVATMPTASDYDWLPLIVRYVLELGDIEICWLCFLQGPFMSLCHVYIKKNIRDPPMSSMSFFNTKKACFLVKKKSMEFLRMFP